jgi:predicted nucleotidyltransferase
MTPSINFRNCSKEQIDMYVKYFASNQNTFISIISKIYLGDQNSWGSPYYSTAIAMFETLNILGLHYETKNYNVLKKIKISANNQQQRQKIKT